MKNIAKFSILALAVATVACADLENPVGPEAPCGDNTLVFTANVPTKTVIADDDRTVSWAAGDEVKFVWADGETVASASNAGSSTTFSITGVPAEVTEIYAVYPSSVCAGFADGEVTIEFGNALEGGEFSKADVCVAKAVKTDDVWNTTLNFKNAACLLKVGVSGEQTTRVQVMAVGEEAIAGNMPVSIDEDGNLVFGETTSGMTTVNMAIDQPGNYYIPVLPNVQLADGFRVNCFEGETSLTPFYYNGAFTTQAGQIIKLSQIESRLGQYYVTPDGAGTKTGQSWTNAMDVDKFKSFVTNQDNHFLLKGATFHFSADEFSFGDDYLIPSFPDHGTVAFTLEGTVSEEKITTFKGRTNTSESNKAGVLWPQANTDLTVRNVNFTGTDGTSNSGAIRINTSSAKLTLEGCRFTENKTAGQGAAIAAFNGKINLKDCDFIDNTALCGAGIFVNGPVVIDVNGGTFEGNSATGSDDTQSAGAVFYASGDATLSFTGVEFLRNYNNVGTNQKAGGILRLQTTTGKAYFNDCLFDANYSYRSTSVNSACAAIINDRIASKYYFNACEFVNNASGTYAGTGAKYGMVIATYNASTFAFNNCYIHDNYGGRNTDPIDWIYIDNASANLIISNTTVIGDPSRKTGPTAGATKKNGNGVIYLSKAGNYYFYNNILCSPSDGASVNSAVATNINSLYNKTSKANSNTTWVTDTGSGHDYYAKTTSFGGLQGYLWDGSMTGTNSTVLAPTSEINNAIQVANADFYNWLNEIGALGKDINGNSRGATSWPGCYQAN